ncbi:hypothetical protein SAMN04487765_0442 [Tenacibaculum sp. MAR_2010_89]|uniref:hypothetical protein n=1 Tax=Tenacibaculum sp. MAR_2010_89 TaxID=1250198 RepID=UPI00089883EA|nr:hypothetical protein [Tenacibaculum sp. MAR_2010_89]SED59117.1 hypothetical protein SAMN04487765_0442 [Tenacibaculum sp. MAR_2010_89]
MVLLFLHDMILTRKIEDKSIVWLSHNNQYIVVENIVANTLILLQKETPIKEIFTTLYKSINIPYNEASAFITDIKKLLKEKITEEETFSSHSIPSTFQIRKYYKINSSIFFIEFLSDYSFSLIHPKFAHLEIDSQNKIDHHYKVFTSNDSIHFYIDNILIGSWKTSESHYFQGKFSMKIIEHTHKEREENWMGVFHASAVSNGEKSILFLGDSGNGKSTSLALLQANGFSCLADDFVPILSKNKEVYSFSSAISIKKNSLPVLLPLYPELETSAEYHFKALNKIVRYLPPKNTSSKQHQPCKTLVFIKYKAESDLKITKISKLDAFQQLVPDSWLSPRTENATSFLDWFDNLSCYKLTYSDNEKMIVTVKKLFNDDL